MTCARTVIPSRTYPHWTVNRPNGGDNYLAEAAAFLGGKEAVTQVSLNLPLTFIKLVGTDFAIGDLSLLVKVT